MSEDNSIQKGYVEYVVTEEDFEPKDSKAPPLKGDDDQFRHVELVRNNQTTEDGDLLIDDKNDYVRIQLSPKGALFGNQVDIFVRTAYHPSIVQFEGYEFYPKHKAVTRYYPNGSLQHLLKEIKEGKTHPEWNGTMKSKCVLGLIAAVTHIHSIFDEENPDFSIRYICPQNIIFDEHLNPRLIHYVFGKEELGVKPNAYIPPELHTNPNGPRYDEDVWDIGMVLYEILTGHEPFQGKSEEEIKRLVIDGELPEFPPESPDTDDIIGIIQNCLAKDPKKRPLPYMIYHHLISLNENLFPDTDKDEYDVFREEIVQGTLQNEESLSYIDFIMKDDQDHTELLRQAESNDALALNIVGRNYQKGQHQFEKNEEKAFEYFMRAANLNNVVGLYNASIFLLEGKGCKKDLNKSFELMKKAAEMNLPVAVHSYAMMVRDGVGTLKDETHALQILQDGANKKYKECLNTLGTMYYDGKNGVERDTDKGLALLKEASQRASEEAQNTLAFIYFNKGKETRNKSLIDKGINLFLKATDHKSASAYLNLARIYQSGDNVPKDVNLAIKYYKESSKLGNVDAMIMYGYYLKKDGNFPLAATVYREAASKGDDRGRTLYAQILYKGEGRVPKDVVTAARYFKMAADNGNTRAMFFYAKILINGEGGVAKNIGIGKSYLKKYFDLTPEAKRLEGWEDLRDA